MPLTLITGPANAGKARAALDAARAEAVRGREPPLIVPTRADAAHYRRELAGGGVVFGVRVERFRGLVDEMARRANVSSRPLGALARERVADAISARTPLRSLAGAASTPGFARAVAELVAELQAERVEPRRLRGALRAWAGQDAERLAYAEDVSALYDGYRQALERLGRCDGELAAARALDALRRAPATWRGTPVVFYGFDDLTALQLDAIETLARVVDAPVTVTLAYEAGRMAFAGRATTFQTLLPLASEHGALAPRAEHYAAGSREALHHLERCLFEPGAPRMDPGTAVRLMEAGGERAELELVAGEIVALLARGVAAGEIAVVLRSPASAAALLAEVLDAHAIPHALERRLPFRDTALGRGLLGLLRSALLNGSVDDLLAWMRSPGLLERPELADGLEAQARAGGATSATAARELWERRNWPLEALDRLRQAASTGAAELLARTAEELERMFCAPRRRQAPRLSGAELEDARALAVGRRAIAELRELSLAAPELAFDAPSLVSALERAELVAGEPPGPDSVAVVDPLALRARRVRALFLCGLQEGVFPAPARPEPFLADEERRLLAHASGLRLPRRDDGLGAERYLLYATLSRPEELLFLSWHTADDDGAPAAPSMFLEDVCDLFTPRLREQRRRRALGAVHWPGPGPATAWAAAREQALAGARARPASIAPLRDERVLTELREQSVWSASGLETWAGCPVRWFVERLLRADDLEPDPEAMVRGGLAHAVLEATLRGLERETGSARLTPESLPVARRLMRDTLDERAEDFPLSVRPERIPSARRRLESDLERYLEHATRTGSSLEPRHLELSFGFQEEEEGGLPALEIGGGVRVRGRIDRVDVGAGGEAVVYDYKGRSAPEAGKWVSGAHFQIAIYMRAVESLLGVRAVGGFYQPLAGRDLRARGVLAAESGVELACVNGDRRDQAQVETLVADALATARAAADQARAGALEPRPATCAYDGGCLYPTICRCET